MQVTNNFGKENWIFFFVQFNKLCCERGQLPSTCTVPSYPQELSVWWEKKSLSGKVNTSAQFLHDSNNLCIWSRADLSQDRCDGLTVLRGRERDRQKEGQQDIGQTEWTPKTIWESYITSAASAAKPPTNRQMNFRIKKNSCTVKIGLNLYQWTLSNEDICRHLSSTANSCFISIYLFIMK